MEIQVTKKDYSKLSDVVYNIEVKQADLRKNEVKEFTTISECEEQVRLFKALAGESKAAREPITKKLDEVKSRLMETEKILIDRAAQSENMLRKVKQAEWQKAEDARKKADEEAKKYLDDNAKRIQFINDCTAIFDKNVEWYMVNKDKMKLTDFVAKLKSRIQKEENERGYKYDLNIIDTWARDLEFGGNGNATIIEVAQKVAQEQNKAIIQAAVISTSVQSDVKPPKKIYELQLTDENILRDVLITWAGNFQFINDKLRVKDLTNIKISSVIDIICKNREEIDTNLVFTVKEEFK